MAKDNSTYSIEDEIHDTTMNASHVVILGAGASLQAFPRGDRDGRVLPLMNNFIEVVGLGPILSKHSVPFAKDENFEDLYSRIRADPKFTEGTTEVEQAVSSYFSMLELPDLPTVYDHLVLSLRGKDVIATFNWDPFLFSALRRNHQVGDMPHVFFLHGAVNIGYCKQDKKKGFISGHCPVCGKLYTPTRMLYPVSQKNYLKDEFVEPEWVTVQRCLEHAHILTIFGYGAPKSDTEAIALLKQAWGDPHSRSLEQTEIIDVKPEEELRKTWDGFIHTHHYGTMADFYDSWIANHPRRTCDAMWAQNMEMKFVDGHPIPRELGFEELWEWYRPLIEAEKSDKEKSRQS